MILESQNLEYRMLPKNWHVLNVEDFLIQKKGAIKIGPFGSQLKKDTMVAFGFKVYGQENIFEKSMEFGNRYITKQHFDRLKSCELFPGDFIISMMGTIGKCMVVPEKIQKGIMDSHLLRLQLDQDVINSSFLSHLFGSPLVLNQVKKLAVGGIMDGLSSSIVKKIKFVCPPLDEQQKIAEILSTVDEKIEVIEAQILQTQELKKGLMQKLLTKGIGHTKFKDSPLGKIPESWEVVKIEEIADVKGGKRLPKGKFLISTLTQHPYIRIADMYMGGVELSNIQYVPDDIFPLIQRYTISKEDLFISVAGTLGIVGFIPVELDGANLTENANKLTNIKIDRNFLYYIMTSENIQSTIKKEMTNNAQPKLALTRIKDFLIPKPQIEEQQKISTIFLQIDLKINTLSQKSKDYLALKKGLMHQLLTGKLRVNQTSHHEQPKPRNIPATTAD